ncbi:MAG: hypothetical protein M1820_007338 [Bogoriella megaspora]|nr:MAG: hypothetical protein M1820_007338 [Bogoriella megaspora]
MENAANNVGPPDVDCEISREPGMIATALAVAIFASIVIILRIIVRVGIVRKVGWDDYTIVAATLGIVIGCALVIVQMHYGYGKHQDCLSTWHFIEFQKYSYGEWIQTFQTLMFNKLSICFFLLRIPVEKIYIRPIQGAIIFLIVSNVILTFLWIFQCNPIAGAWNTLIPAKCFGKGQLQRIIIAQALISIISDFLLALFPIVLLWKVKISMRIKVGLCCLMALGLITASFCIVRTVLNYQNINDDVTWESVPNWTYRSWEVGIGVVAASVPALRPGYKVVASTVHSYTSTRSASTTQKRLHDTHANSGGKNVDDLEDKVHLAKELVNPGSGSHERAKKVARHTASVEADRANAFGEGDESLGMRGLRGDVEPVSQGITKTTWFDVNTGTDRSDSEVSRIRDLESGERLDRGFV